MAAERFGVPAGGRVHRRGPQLQPIHHLLPIRRLDLAVGVDAEVRAAWLRFPSFTLEPLPQVYRRLSEEVYRYESAGGAFVRDLTVDTAGFVTLYPGLFEPEPAV